MSMPFCRVLIEVDSLFIDEAFKIIIMLFYVTLESGVIVFNHFLFHPSCVGVYLTMYIHICVCVFVCMCVCMYVHICVPGMERLYKINSYFIVNTNFCSVILSS